MIRLRHMNKPVLLEAIRDKLPSRLKRSMGFERVALLGVFRHQSRSFIGLRFRTAGRRYEYVRVFEQRQGVAFNIVLNVTPIDFDFSWWTGEGSERHAACQRLRDKTQRRGKRETPAISFTHQMPHGAHDYCRDAVSDL